MNTVKRTSVALALALLLTAPAAFADFANVQANMKAGKWAEVNFTAQDPGGYNASVGDYTVDNLSKLFAEVNGVEEEILI